MFLAVRTVKARELSTFNYIYLNVQILPGTTTINKELMCLLANVRARYTHFRCKANVDEPMYMLDMRLLEYKANVHETSVHARYSANVQRVNVHVR